MGTILFYIAKSGTFDENNSLLKLGRTRLSFQPNPFSLNATTFEQRLVINDGYVQFLGANNSRLVLWVDVFDPVIHVDFSIDYQVDLKASLESWRTEDRPMPLDERAQSSWQTYPNVSVYQYHDTVDFFDNGILSYHRNNDQTVFDATVRQQGLEQYKDTMYNPLNANTFGLWLAGGGLVPQNTTYGQYVSTNYTSWNLESSSESSTFNVSIYLHQNQSTSLQAWQSELQSLINAPRRNHSDTIDWWHSFWNRSHIVINPNSNEPSVPYQVGRNYNLFRYTLACNAYGEWPTRFNGGLFTFDSYFVDDTLPYSADFRRWSGGTFTAQNQRLLYWPMLKSGDIDMMKSQFDFYQRVTATNQLRGRLYYDINQTFFTEQIENFGLPQIYQFNADTYIFNSTRPAMFPRGLEFNEWLIWLQDTCVCCISSLTDLTDT